jgi:hypothetical protein
MKKNAVIKPLFLVAMLCLISGCYKKSFVSFHVASEYPVNETVVLDVPKTILTLESYDYDFWYYSNGDIAYAEQRNAKTETIKYNGIVDDRAEFLVSRSGLSRAAVAFNSQTLRHGPNAQPLVTRDTTSQEYLFCDNAAIQSIGSWSVIVNYCEGHELSFTIVDDSDFAEDNQRVKNRMESLGVLTSSMDMEDLFFKLDAKRRY